MDSPNPTDVKDGITTFHTLWTAAITAAGGIVVFFTKRTFDRLDAKADRCDVDNLKRDIKDFIESQNDRHESNTQRLDQIIMTMGKWK